VRTCLVIFALALSAAAAFAKPEIKDIKAAYGKLGPERKSNEYIPGDQVFYRFMLSGIRTDAENRIRVEFHITVTNPKGKVVLKRELPSSGKCALGGDTLPGDVTVDIPPSLEAGEYCCDIEFVDLIADEKATTRQSFTVKPLEFALVALRFYYDEKGEAPARVGGMVSQTLYVRADAVGFDKSSGEIDLEFEILVLDRDGKTVAPKMIHSTFHLEKAEQVKMADKVTFIGNMTLNRPGDFRLRITLTDKQTKKKVEFESPLRVESP
jgi:hypothetical protein